MPVVLRYRTLCSQDWLPERTRKDLTICFVFRQQKEVADVLQCVDDDRNGNSLFLFSQGEARRSLRSVLNTVRQRVMRIQ
jgi:hypothetical protein